MARTALAADEFGDRLYHEPAHEPAECPVCHRLYEAPFVLEGHRIPGHVPGSPICKAALGGQPIRDARDRRAARGDR